MTWLFLTHTIYLTLLKFVLIEFNQSTNIADYNLDDLILYNISLIGLEEKEQHSKIFGSYNGYCLNSSCKFKNLRRKNK